MALAVARLAERGAGPRPGRAPVVVLPAGPHDRVLAPVRGWLRRYFAVPRDRQPGAGFPDAKALRLDLEGTEFEVAVWRALLDIPAGETWSYRDLAARLGRPQGARAIGGAVGRNPVAIVVPCHRIVGADGSLTGFGGGVERKRWLLAHEHARLPGAPPPDRQMALFAGPVLRRERRGRKPQSS
jgi:O-6-methylguanine DNA methyltransferase